MRWRSVNGVGRVERWRVGDGSGRSCCDVRSLCVKCLVDVVVCAGGWCTCGLFGLFG